jgi:hypothetical protein
LSSFEFAQIPMAIILGFGITEILASSGYQLRNRGRAPWSPLHFAASAWILLLSVRYIWIQWGWRGIEWTYVDYVMAVGPALALALAAHVAKIDVATPRSHPIYEQCRRPLCLLLAAWVVLSLARGNRVAPPGFSRHRAAGRRAPADVRGHAGNTRVARPRPDHHPSRLRVGAPLGSPDLAHDPYLSIDRRGLSELPSALATEEGIAARRDECPPDSPHRH